MWTQTKTVFMVVFTRPGADEEIRIESSYDPKYFESLLTYVHAVAPMNKVKAIKFVRAELKCGLRNAKYFVDCVLHEAEMAERFYAPVED